MPPRKTRPKAATKSAAGSKAPRKIASTGVVADTDVVIDVSATDRSNAAAAAAAAVLTATTTTDACNSQPEETIRSVTYSSIAVNANVHESLIQEGTVKSPLEVAIENYFDTPSVAEFDDNTPHIYTINDVFLYPYWVEDIQPERFASTLSDGILYRPDIVNEIYDIVALNLCSHLKKGLMIKGPQGIGKSHSIVNLVWKLLSTRNYLVTFIPNCNTWRTSYDLVNAICDSFGASYDLLGFPYSKRDMNEYDFKEFIKAVDAVLKKENKQWIFVFDQINRIFARFPEKKDIGVLDFPFDMMGGVISAGRITSIISASANNEISYKSQHSGFLEYIHQINMTNEEIEMVFHSIKNIDRVMHVTGNVPLYAAEFIEIDEDEDKFEFEYGGNVGASINKLICMTNANLKDELYENMIKMLLLMDFDKDPNVYDRKYFVRVDNTPRFQAILPLAESAWRDKVKDKLFQYTNEKEAELLRVLRRTDTTKDTRGRLFENIVIRRCIVHGVENFPLSLVSLHEVLNKTVSVPRKHFYFGSDHLPSMTVNEDDDGIHIPINCNFPAIDVVWKSGIHVFGVQIHTSSTHSDVASTFEQKCQKAGWFDKFEGNVFLIYLCPDNKSMMKSKQSNTDSGRVKIGYITIAQVECLKNIQM